MCFFHFPGYLLYDDLLFLYISILTVSQHILSDPAMIVSAACSRQISRFYKYSINESKEKALMRDRTRSPAPVSVPSGIGLPVRVTGV